MPLGLALEFFKHQNISITKEIMDIFSSSCLLVSSGQIMHIVMATRLQTQGQTLEEGQLRFLTSIICDI